MPDPCLRNDYIVWVDWKTCKRQHLSHAAWSGGRMKGMAGIAANATTISSPLLKTGNAPAFETFIIENRDYLP